MTTTALPFDENKCAVFLVREENAKGPGVLYVIDDRWEYLSVDDEHWSKFPAAFHEALTRQIEDDGNVHFFIVVRKVASLDVIKYARATAALRCVEMMCDDEQGRTEAAAAASASSLLSSGRS